MEIQELRDKCLPLMQCRSIPDCLSLIDLYADFIFKAVQNHHEEDKSSAEKIEAKIILQMMLAKVLHLKSIVNGINYGNEQLKLENIIDPTFLAVLIRNVYETVGAFNLIYRLTQSSDERLIVHNLWVHAGLSYRQKFVKNITLEDSLLKSEGEKKVMAGLIAEIEATELF